MPSRSETFFRNVRSSRISLLKSDRRGALHSARRMVGPFARGGKTMRAAAMTAAALLSAACGLDLDDPPAVIHARFDPDDRAIPMPTNVVRDDDLGRLAIPTDDEELSAA